MRDSEATWEDGGPAAEFGSRPAHHPFRGPPTHRPPRHPGARSARPRMPGTPQRLGDLRRRPPRPGRRGPPGARPRRPRPLPHRLRGLGDQRGRLPLGPPDRRPARPRARGNRFRLRAREGHRLGLPGPRRHRADRRADPRGDVGAWPTPAPTAWRQIGALGLGRRFHSAWLSEHLGPEDRTLAQVRRQLLATKNGSSKFDHEEPGRPPPRAASPRPEEPPEASDSPRPAATQSVWIGKSGRSGYGIDPDELGEMVEEPDRAGGRDADLPGDDPRRAALAERLEPGDGDGRPTAPRPPARSRRRRRRADRRRGRGRERPARPDRPLPLPERGRGRGRAR